MSVAGWTSTPINQKPATGLSAGQRGAVNHLAEAAARFVELNCPTPSLEELRDELVHRKVDYNGNVVSVRRRLTAAKVIPAWPEVGEAAQCGMEGLLQGELRDDLADPRRCLLPQSQWPEVTPRSSVHADDDEWYEIVKAGWGRGMFVEVPEEEIFRNEKGDLILAGAMGSTRPKRLQKVRLNF